MSGNTLLELVANLGILGPILAIFGWYIWKIHNQLRKSEEQRVADANAILEKMMALSNKWHDLQMAHVRVLDANTGAIEEIRNILRTLADNSIDQRASRNSVSVPDEPFDAGVVVGVRQHIPDVRRR